MTTISSAPPFDMEFLQPEDTMELASSPHIPQDDLDLDLDTMHEPDAAPEDSMVEDVFDDDRIETTDPFDDDDMVDEDTAIQHFPDNASDLHMEAHDDHETALEDEDILYEDDEMAKDSDFVRPGIDADHHHAEQPFRVADDLEVSGTHNEEEFAFTEQENKERVTFADHSHMGGVAENSNEQSLEDEQQDVTQAKDIYEDSYDAIPGHRVDEKALEEPFHEHDDTATERRLEPQDSAISTNPIDPAEAVHETEGTNQNTTEHPSTIAKETELEEHSYQLETQNVALHTVKVIYQDSEMYLFPPQSEDGADTFFLSERSLAHESFDKLLASCRDVLADTIGDDDELVLDVASLGLHISEGSKYAAEITLSQILDVYLRLSHNDNLEQIEPLYCNLSSRVCLASQYAYLAASAQEGKTITEIAAEHMESPEMEELGEQQENVEHSIEDSATYDDHIETTLPPPEPSGLDYTEHDEDAADLPAKETTGSQADEHLDTTGTNDNLEADHNHENERKTDVDNPEAAKAIDPWIAPVEIANAEDTGIQPDETEYQEDIDEVAAGDDHHESVPEQPATDDQHFDARSINDETASSGTVEAEVGDHREEHFEDSVQHDEIPLEPFVDGDDQTRDTSDVFEAQQEQPAQIVQKSSKNANSSQFEQDDAEDYLDLGPEDQELPPINEREFAAEPEATEAQDLEETEDLFAEADDSTDHTLNNNQGEDLEEDALDVHEFPVTPVKTRSAKRKVEAEADNEDDFDLFDIETPDKKRTRPS